MGDILSQNEIDTLLQQLNAGEVDVIEFNKESTEKKVRSMISAGQANLRRTIFVLSR